MTHDATLQRRLRSFVAFVVAIGAVVVVLGALPGERAYLDDDPCARLQNREELRACTSPNVGLIEEHRAAALGIWIPLALALLPAYAIWRRPRRNPAWAWFGWALTALAIAGYFAVRELVRINFEGFRTEVLWPRHAFTTGATALAALFLVVLPAILLVTRPPPAMPDARVVG